MAHSYCCSNVHCKYRASKSRREGYGQRFTYKVLNDDPGNFVAINDNTKTVGNLSIISLDRETGTPEIGPLVWGISQLNQALRLN